MREDHPPGDRLEHPRHVHVDLPVEEPVATLDHDHRAVVEEGDALAGFLAFLDDLDAQLLAGQERRLHGVGQRVHVEHPHALEIGDPVQVEIRREDRATCRPREAHELTVDLGDPGHIDVAHLDRHRPLLQRRQDLQTAPAAIAAKCVGRIGDALELIEDEARDDELAIDEPGGHDVGQAAVDDRARVHEDALPRPAPFAPGPGQDAERLGRSEEILALGHGRPEHAQPEDDRHADGQEAPEGLLEGRERQSQEQPHEEPEGQPEDRSDELPGRHVLDGPQDRPGRIEGQVGQHHVADHPPGGHPDQQEDDGVRLGAEGADVGGQDDGDQDAETGPQQAYVACHVDVPEGEAGHARRPKG